MSDKEPRPPLSSHREEKTSQQGQHEAKARRKWQMRKHYRKKSGPEGGGTLPGMKLTRDSQWGPFFPASQLVSLGWGVLMSSFLVRDKPSVDMFYH